MFLVGLLSSAASLAIGWGLKKYNEGDRQYNITDREFQLSAVVICTVVAPLVVLVGNHLAIQSNVTYTETRSGWEQAANQDITTCHRDGSCHWTYQCDPYTVTTTYKDSDGKTQTRTETKYHDCPYFTEEWRFVLNTTVGQISIADHNAPANPTAHLWRAWVSAPSHIPSGYPATWLASKARLDAGKPGPVAVRWNYENYILASENLLKKQSDRIASYKEKGMMPDFQHQIEQDYLQNRIYWVMSPARGDWLQAINRFNAAFGDAKQGDLHLLLVDAKRVDNPDYYASAVAAYWQSAAFGKQALSKNAVVAVVGVENGKVAWARASSGMPIGNEALFLKIQNELPGTEVTPEKLLGVPTATISQSQQVTYTLPQGELGKLLWQFERVCMRCDGQDGSAHPGYLYLLNQVQPDTLQQVLIGFAVVLASGAVWYVVLRN